MTKEQFLYYIDSFNKKRYDTLKTYFCPDVTVEYFDNYLEPDVPALTLQGPEAFVEHYRRLHEYVKETLDVRELIITEDRIFVELYVEFLCLKDDPPKNRFGLRKAGDIFCWTGWVLYDVESDKFKRIRIAYHRMHRVSISKPEG